MRSRSGSPAWYFSVATSCWVVADMAGQQADAVHYLGYGTFGVAGRGERVDRPGPEGAHVPQRADRLALGRVGVVLAQQRDQPAGHRDGDERDHGGQAVPGLVRLAVRTGGDDIDRRDDLGGEHQGEGAAHGQRGGEIGVVDEQTDGPGFGDGAAALLVGVAVAGAHVAVRGARGGAGVGGGYRRWAAGGYGRERAGVAPVAEIQHDARCDRADQQPDGRGTEGEYWPGHGERILRHGHEVNVAGFGRAEQAGHAEVDHGGEQPAEGEAQRRHQRGEVTAQVGTDGAVEACRAGPPGQAADHDAQRDEQDPLREQQDDEERGQPRQCSRVPIVLLFGPAARHHRDDQGGQRGVQHAPAPPVGRPAGRSARRAGRVRLPPVDHGDRVAVGQRHRAHDDRGAREPPRPRRSPPTGPRPDDRKAGRRSAPPRRPPRPRGASAAG